MSQTIIAEFDTRRAAELAVEHLVQEHGLNRADIFVEAAEAENTAGTRRSGSDAESGHPQTPPHGNPALSGRIRVSTDIQDDALSDTVRATLQEQGALSVTRH